MEKLSKIANNPIDISQIKKKNKKKRQASHRLNLSTIAKKNPNFKLSAYQTIHKAKLNERMLQTLRRNDIDRPKVL